MKKMKNAEVRDDIAKMVERLKQTKADADAADAREGERDGRFWAMRIGTYRDLRALEEVADGFSDPVLLGDEPGVELAVALASALNKLFGEERTPADMLEELFTTPGQANSAAYVVSFVGAAMKVWEEAKPQLAG
mgnify:CR=1 FL=1